MYLKHEYTNIILIKQLYYFLNVKDSNDTSFYTEIIQFCKYHMKEKL